MSQMCTVYMKGLTICGIFLLLMNSVNNCKFKPTKEHNFCLKLVLVVVILHPKIRKKRDYLLFYNLK